LGKEKHVTQYDFQPLILNPITQLSQYPHDPIWPIFTTGMW